MGKEGWNRFLRYAVSGLAVWLLARQVDGAALVEALAKVKVAGVVAAVVVYLVGQLMTAYRWRIISERVGFSESFSGICRYYFIGMFFNLFGPSTLGGDVVRSLYLGQTDGRRTVAFNTVVFDRLSGLAVLVLVAVTAMLAFGSYNLPPVLSVLTVVSGIGMLAGWWLIPPLARVFFEESNRIRQLVENDLGPFWHDRWLLWDMAWVSAVFHVVQVVAVIMLGESLGLGLPWPYYFLFHPMVTIFSALPISLAGLGIREIGYVYFLADLSSVAREAALAFGILWLLVLLVASGVGGIVFLATGSSLPQLRGGDDLAQ